MAGIVWLDVYNIGVSDIDAQHRKLIEIINDLTQAHFKSMGQTAIADILNRLFDYTHYHFTSEEQMQLDYKYPDRIKHKAEHQEFIDKLNQLKEDADNNNLLLTLKTLDFLKDWTITHILGTDKAFGEYLRKVELQ